MKTEPHFLAYPVNGPDGVIPGMTIRQAFAMAAMQGMLANPYNNSIYVMGVNCINGEGFIDSRMAAEASVRHADALIKALNQT